jgi:hypothetical protein
MEITLWEHLRLIWCSKHRSGIASKFARADPSLTSLCLFLILWLCHKNKMDAITRDFSFRKKVTRETPTCFEKFYSYHLSQVQNQTLSIRTRPCLVQTSDFSTVNKNERRTSFVNDAFEATVSFLISVSFLKLWIAAIYNKFLMAIGRNSFWCFFRCRLRMQCGKLRY